MTVRVLEGDCLSVMPTLEADSIDAVICDPPYGLKFMGKEWDHGIPGVPFWEAAKRVAKPGAYLLAFGGTRTHHRLMVAIEDAGWEIRDCLMWLHGQGFPKGKAQLKPAWEPIVMARKKGPLQPLNIDGCRIGTSDNLNGGAYAKEGTRRDDGWGMQRGDAGEYQQPAGRWPANLILDETSAALLDEQSGDLKDGVAVRHRSNGTSFGSTRPKPPAEDMGYGGSGGASRFFFTTTPDKECDLCFKSIVANAEIGSAPTLAMNESIARSDAWDSLAESNARLARSAAVLCDLCETAFALGLAAVQRNQRPEEVVGLCSISGHSKRTLLQSLALIAEMQGDTAIIPTTALLKLWSGYVRRVTADTIRQEGRNGASAPLRFRYDAKASRSEREAGLESHEKRPGGTSVKGYTDDVANGYDRNRPVHNHHPTVKPLDLMQWLCRLVTPKGGLILDPFCGSGTTGRAAVAGGFSFIGIEKSPEYAAIARARIAEYAPLFGDVA